MLIRIAFCFDENLVNQIQATIASLLDARKDTDISYEIYCICTKEASSVKSRLSDIIAARKGSSDDSLIMKVIENPYQNSFERKRDFAGKKDKVSSATYLRLILHRILPDVDRIIYADVDVLFRDNLAPVWRTNLDGYALAAVKGPVNASVQWELNAVRPYWQYLSDVKGKYINAGILFLNLEEIRKRQLEKQWDIWAKEKLHYQDQDILNITCKDAICYLPLKYNRFAYMTKRDFDDILAQEVYTKEEYREAMQSPVIIHYAADKPWNRYDTNLGNLWWDYVNSQPDLQDLFDEKKARKNHGPTLLDRAVRKAKRMIFKEKY